MAEVIDVRMSMARLVITAVVVEGRSQSEVARSDGVSQPWVSRLVARYRAEGEAAYPAPGAADHTRHQPRRTREVIDRILQFRRSLTERGLDAVPHTLVGHLQQEHMKVLPATISRPDPARRRDPAPIELAEEPPPLVRSRTAEPTVAIGLRASRRAPEPGGGRTPPPACRSRSV